MPFTPEDGTGVVDANSYASVEFADAYFLLRRNAVWASLTSDQKEAALVQATDYIDNIFGGRFIGWQATETQSLLWPRAYLDDELYYPERLQKACSEYALRASSSPLQPDAEVDESGQLILKRVEKVGPVDEEITFQSGGASFYNTPRPYPAADAYMRGLYTSASGGGVIRN